MDKNIANAMLLRLNKQDQIEALKSIGFTTVNENTPASDIAKYMQWSGTLLDLSLATLRIEDGEQVFFTASEWNSMSANNRSKYIRIGIRLRAECHQFIIAKSDCVDAGGNKTFKWGGYGTDLRGLKNYGNGNQGLYDTFDGKENTDVILETLAGVKDTQGTVGTPAAEVARAYKACTLDDRIHRLRHADEDQSCAGPRRTHGRQRRSARIADGPAQEQDAAEIALVRLARPPREPAAEPLRVHDRNIRHFSFPHLPQCSFFRYYYNVPQKNSQIPGGFPLQPLKKYVKILAIQKKSCDRAAGCRMRAQRGCVAVSTPRRQCRPSPASFRLNVL